MDRIDPNGLEWEADVLVIGGGPAAAWAAIAAAERGANVVVADKGFLGTSGAFAAASSTHLVVPPLAQLRDPVKFERYASGGHLSQHRWWDRLLEITYDKAPLVWQWGGYDVPVYQRSGSIQSLTGFETMHILRRTLLKKGVHILDQCPALELLVDAEGVVAGAKGLQRQMDAPWTVRAGAVVMACGGVAWLSKALGCSGNTGDGLLMAVEAGGELSGMEFTAHYVPAPLHAPSAKSVFLKHASYRDKEGREIGRNERDHGLIEAIGRELLDGPVFCRLDVDTADETMRRGMRLSDPHFFASFDKLGIDPFEQGWEVTLVHEGTVRGTGGIRIVDDECGTSAPGLFAAGDAATRELLCGGASGGSGTNMTWSIGSAHVAGRAAADFARAQGPNAHDREVESVGRAGLEGEGPGWEAGAVIRSVQNEMFPLEKNLFRSEKTLLESLARLEEQWKVVQGEPLQDTGKQMLRSREAASLLAAARWSCHAGLQRNESRGMHIRLDHPHPDPAQRHYLAVGGLDRLWSRPVEVPEAVVEPRLSLRVRQAA